MSTLLVMTVGQTDVQLVEDEQRWEFDKRRCAALHDELENRLHDWSIVPSSPKKCDRRRTELPSGRFELCTPKLDAILCFIKKDNVLAEQSLCVLILETRRDRTRWPQEPRFSGTVLERRLREYGCQDVRRSTFMTGSERLEDVHEPRDAMVRREVVERIDIAVHQAIEDKKPDRIIVATTGGFPTVASLVDEVVRLYAGTVRVDLVETPDELSSTGESGNCAVSRHWLPEPAESYRARRRALDLIENGSLLGAWGAVRHLHDDEVERKWTRVVEWLSLFASSLPLPDECDLALLRHPIMAVKVAVRVELALRANDIPRAIHGTIAFFEAALWDHLIPHLQEQTKRVYKVDPPPDKSLVRVSDESKLTSRRKREDNLKRPFVPPTTESSDENYYKIFDDNVGSIKLAKDYLKRDHLTELGKTVSKVRDLRNDVAHNDPTPKLMDEAGTRMAEVGLWPDVFSPERSIFLAQPLIAAVLDELGVKNSENLLGSLLGDVRQRILEPR